MKVVLSEAYKVFKLTVNGVDLGEFREVGSMGPIKHMKSGTQSIYLFGTSGPLEKMMREFPTGLGFQQEPLDVVAASPDLAVKIFGQSQK